MSSLTGNNSVLPGANLQLAPLGDSGPDFNDLSHYDGYRVNALGHIESNCYRNGKPLPAGKWRRLTPNVGKNGYATVTLYKKGGGFVKLFVHRIVAEAFISNPHERRTVNHKNGIKTDNRVENLEWMTHGENIAHSHRFLFRKPVSRSVLTDEDRWDIKILRSFGAKYKDLADAFNAPIGQIEWALNGWRPE